MMTHIAALISAIVLTEWLIVAGWMSGSNSFYYWAGAVVLVWWLATRRNNPPWPSPGNFHLRILVYLTYFLATIVIAVVAGNWRAYAIVAEIIILSIFDLVTRGNRKKEEEEEPQQE